MPAGLNANLTKQLVDETIGKTAQEVNLALIHVADTALFLAAYQDADLEALGYDAADIANVRSAYADLDQLRRVYEGGEALTAAKDFRTFAQRLYGTGWAGY